MDVVRGEMAFAERVQDLPQELYDKIYDLVFAVKIAPREIRVDKSYTPPAFLQLSRDLREEYANVYYGWNDFLFQIDTSESLLRCNRSYLHYENWLASLPKTHRAKLRCLTIQHVRNIPTEDLSYSRDKQRNERKMLRVMQRQTIRDLQAGGSELEPGALSVELLLRNTSNQSDMTISSRGCKR